MEIAVAELAELDSFAERVGHRFADASLLTEALSHRSWCNEHNSDVPRDRHVASNERLEFLGDAVLGLCVCELAVTQWPELGPGELSVVRSAVVSAVALAGAARDCDLGSALLLGRGEAATGGADKESILADALEAVLGAVFLDGGLGAARDVVRHLLGERIAAAASEPGARQAKNRFQELVARRFGAEPTYEVSSSGPAHRLRFEAEARIETEVWGRGEGSTKRAAELRAAEAACLRLRGAEPKGEAVARAARERVSDEHSEQERETAGAAPREFGSQRLRLDNRGDRSIVAEEPAHG
ncbi:ribonuclease III [Candidatus Poriferisodalis sp.]|uniref:ribonuclease III n=1 Tax=Candidatus Poriferisodalis sp. TaxID=3101277 RepID=UPI003B02BD92